MFYLSQKHNLAVAQIPKAGLMTIREWLGPDFRVVSNDETKVVTRRVAFVRNPIERLKSCYSFFYWLSVNGQLHVSGAPLSSWGVFVDHVLSGAEDEHWIPQSRHFGDAPNIWRRFESLPECYEEFKPGILPHNNRVTRLETYDYRTEELLQYYAQDFKHWSTL